MKSLGKILGSEKKIEKLDTDEKRFLRKTIENNLFMTIINISVLYDNKKKWPKWNEVLSFFQIAKDIWYNTIEKEIEKIIENVFSKIYNIKKYRTKVLAHVDYKCCFIGFDEFKEKYKFSYQDLSDLINIWYNIVNVLKSYNNWSPQELRIKINEHTQYKQTKIVEKIISSLV